MDLVRLGCARLGGYRATGKIDALRGGLIVRVKRDICVELGKNLKTFVVNGFGARALVSRSEGFELVAPGFDLKTQDPKLKDTGYLVLASY